MYRSAKYNHSNYELIEYSNVVNTYLLLMKRFTFLLLRKLFSLVIHPDILCIVYIVAQLCACRIVHLDLESKSLLSSVPLNNCYYELLFIHSPPLPFFFLVPFWWFFATSSSILFLGILYTNHTLNEDQIVGRSIIKTGISQRGELWFNSAVLMKTFIYFYIYNNIYLFFFYF